MSPTFLADVDGFEATFCTDGRTHLVGVVPDQIRLRDLFTRLLDLEIELGSVNPVTTRPGPWILRTRPVPGARSRSCRLGRVRFIECMGQPIGAGHPNRRIDMTQYLSSRVHPDGAGPILPPEVLDTIMVEIGVVHDELKARGSVVCAPGPRWRRSQGRGVPFTASLA